MAEIKQFLDITGLSEYDGLIKNYVDTESAKAYKTILTDGDTIKFYKKENATLTDVADKEVSVSGSDVENLKDIMGSATLTTTAQTVTEAINELDADVTDINDKIDKVEASIGTVTEGKTVVEMITDAQTAATYDDTQVKADIKTNADAIDVLNGTGVGSVDKKITDAFNEFATNVTDDAVVNSYKELIDWAAEHGSEATEMAAAITALENIVDGIGGEGESATVVAHVNAAIEALKIGDYAKASNLADAVDRIAALETAIGEGGNVGTQIDDKIAELDADVTSTTVETGKGVQVQVVEVDGKVTTVAVTGNYDNTYDAKGAAVQALTDAKAYSDKLSDNYDPAGSSASVLGTAEDDATANTVYGTKARIKAVEDRVAAIEDITIESIPNSEITALFQN